MIHLGIDFGTANTRVSKLGNLSVPAVIQIGKASYSLDMMPSTCWIDGDGRIEVGEESLARPNRLRFVKRYWQQRPEDRLTPEWPSGKREINGRTYTCEEVVEATLREAVTRALEAVKPSERKNGFTANLVCPVEFDRSKRLALVQMLTKQGAAAINLGNVIDEPLAAAVLYCRIEEHPPVRRDLLVFDAGAGTVDVAIVRYEEANGVKRATVLAEAGRCVAGADLDGVMQEVVLRKLAVQLPTLSPEDVFREYNSDLDAGKIAFEDDCERMKMLLGRNSVVALSRVGLLGLNEAALSVERDEYLKAARTVLFALRDAAQSAVKMAKTMIQDFNGIELAVFVGGTSRLPFVRDCVREVIPGAKVLTNEYLDEMLATVRGAGFSKDFGDLVVLRPPYETRLRVALSSGGTETLVVNEAFQSFPKQQFFYTSVPVIRMSREFGSPIATLRVTFVSPTGKYIDVPDEELDPELFRGSRCIEAQLNVHASLCIRGEMTSKSVRAPYFTQVGLLPAEPFDIRKLNAPAVYPDDN